MPYIPAESRALYDRSISRLLRRLRADTWRTVLAPLIHEIGVRIYGGPDATRYYKQNEFLGVLSCMANEWQARLDIATCRPDAALTFDILSADDLVDWETVIADIANVLRAQPDENRAGHFNYFLTATMIGVVTSGWCLTDYVPSYVRAMERWIYQVTTRPYEERAIAKSGDVYPEEWLQKGKG